MLVRERELKQGTTRMRTSKKLNPHMTSPPQEFEPNSCQSKLERLNLYIKWDEIYQISVWDMTLLVSCAVTSFEMAAIEEFSWNSKIGSLNNDTHVNRKLTFLQSWGVILTKCLGKLTL